MVEQLERRRRRRVTPLSPTLWDAAVIPTKAGRQACLTDTDFIFHEVDAGQSTFQDHNQVPAGREEHSTLETGSVLGLLTTNLV